MSKEKCKGTSSTYPRVPKMYMGSTLLPYKCKKIADYNSVPTLKLEKIK